MQRPRQYASRILALSSRDERTRALEKVPQIYRDLVRKHVEIVFKQKKGSVEASSGKSGTDR